MKIQKISDNKIKVMFNISELEENKITVHSFLSGSVQTKKLLNAVLDIAKEEFNFDVENHKISTETISFRNQDFIIFITKSLISTEIFSITQPKLNSSILYKFNSINEVFSFCKYLNSHLDKNLIYLNNSLFKYDNLFILLINMDNLNETIKNFLFSVLSEYSDYIVLSEYALQKLKEHSFLILENNAIQAL